ncbi:MAG: divalent metal cation transporter [Candidatus Moranbacteria bacterium]|nr:divalent metal cation transporter [Candidatus Moranbacteria bacterium]
MEIKETNQDNPVTSEKFLEKSKKYIKKVGPGVITGAADDDPSGIATYSQTGAQYGNGLVWMSLWTYPLVSVVQEMCARIALVTGRGLASNIKKIYSKKILFFCTLLLLIANTLNIGANLGAMAKAFQLLEPRLPFASVVITIGLIGLVLEILIPYKTYSKYLKWLVFAIFAYVVTGLIIKMSWSKLIIDTIVPSINFSKDQLLIIAGVLGTTISPYLFFWQTSEEVEEEIVEGRTSIKSRLGATKEEVSEMRFDIWTGMFLSNLVMFFIIAVCSHTLFVSGINDIKTASDAAQALRPLAGSWATILFAVGIIGTGLLSIPVLAGSTAYAISESFGWKEGLYRKFKSAHAFYLVIIVSVLIGIILNFSGVNPIKALIYSAILNGIVSPFILFFIVKISSNKKIMGEHKNNKIVSFVGWFTVALMFASAIGAIYALF